MEEAGCNHTCSGGGQGRQQRPEYTMGVLTAVGVPTISIHYHGYWVLPQAHGSGSQWWGSEWRCASAQLVGLAAGEHSDTGQWQKRETDPGPEAPAGTLDVGMPFCSYTVSPRACTWQWRLGKGVRLAVCKYTSGRASPENIHGGEGQP